jgi:hypothetical protein
MSFGRIPGIVALLALAGAPVNLWSYLGSCKFKTILDKRIDNIVTY